MKEFQTDRSILARTEIFRELPEEAIEEARRLAFRKRLDKRDVLYHQGDPSEHVYIVIVGRLRAAQTSADGTQVALRYLGPGEMTGYAAIAGLGEYPSTVAAVDDTHLFGWSGAQLLRLMRDHPQIAINSLAALGARYREAQIRLRELSTEPVEHRIAHTLQRLASQAGRRTAQGIEIRIPLSRQDLAELAGTTLHTVSRILSSWERDGIVASGHRQVLIRSIDALETVTEPA